MLRVPAGVVVEAGVPVQEQREVRHRRLGVVVGVAVGAHNDPLLPVEGLEPLGVVLQAVGGDDPGRAVGEEEVLTDDVALVRLHPVPDVAVHQGDGAARDAQHQLVRRALIGVVVFRVLLALRPGPHDHVAHAGLRHVGQPVGHLDLAGQVRREDLVQDGARPVRVPQVVPAAARAEEELGQVQLEQLAVEVVDVPYVARMVDQLREDRIQLDDILAGEELLRVILRMVPRVPVDRLQVARDLRLREPLRQDQIAFPVEELSLLRGETGRRDAVLERICGKQLPRGLDDFCHWRSFLR